MNTFAKYILGVAALTAPLATIAAEQTGDEKITFLLTGASFSVPENGWFEIGCEDLGAEAINKAVSGEAIYHTARRMNLGTFYTLEELDKTDVFVIGHVHNQNVANEQWLKDKWEDYTNIASTTDYSVAYDYVIKRYIADCEGLKDNPESKYYGTEHGKPAKIMLCTHWHDARTTYNPAIRKLAEKWNLPLVKFDENIGFSRLDAETQADQPSLGFAHDTETIGGVKYGWHPLRGSNSYIQRRMAQIFVEEACDYLGLEVPFDYALAPASPLVAKGETARMMVTFTAGHYPFTLNGAEVTECPYFWEVADAESDVTFHAVGVTDARGTQALRGESKATIHIADKVISASYDSFVHQAEQSKGHADAQTLDLKNGDGWSRRIYITFPLDEVPDDAARIGVRLYYESVVPGKLNNENRPLDGIETLELGGNTSTYTANLTWDNHHNHVFEPVATTLLTQNMLESYVGWDVTDFVKARIKEGAVYVTFRVSTPYRWRALSRFTSTESTTNQGKGPQMLVAMPRGTTSALTPEKTDPEFTIIGGKLMNPFGKRISINTMAGQIVSVTDAATADFSSLAPGVYIAASNDQVVKFVNH
ncbi:MAG: DUF5040 domain-containing protein [[Clostridium] fimetarium]|nr:DUF5040 domain-containing protein [Alistipes timonensis]MCM1405221.1 DUF5040 domain-containing protein [[Clostridium] fimetarium]